MSIFTRFLSFIILIIFSGSGQILQKRGVLNLDLTGSSFSLPNILSLIPRVINNYWLVGGIFFMGLTLLLYLLILSKVELGSFYPVFVSGTIILVAVASRLFLNEILSLWQVSGILIIILGIFLMFFRRKTYGRR